MNIHWIFLWDLLVALWPEVVSGSCDKLLTLGQNSVTVRFVVLFLKKTHDFLLLKCAKYSAKIVGFKKVGINNEYTWFYDEI